MRRPRVEQMPGIQSMNVTWTGTVSYGASGGGLACEESVQASKKIAKARAN